MIARPLFVVILLTLMLNTLAVSGCVSGSGDSLPHGSYVAIEERLIVTSTVIDGEDLSMPHITLPQVFNYDGSATGSNPAEGSSWTNGGQDLYYPQVNESFKVLYGTSIYRNVAPRDTRTGLRINGVYDFPYTGESGFTVQNIDRNGIVYGSYENSSIILRPGDQWIAPLITETRSGNGTSFLNKPYNYTAMYNTTWTITNLGTINKANLTLYHNCQSAVGYSWGFW